jgi:3-deoxy-manno-octulosonate cytidylyltransferase (CMP-KDO synthetase)
VSGRALYFSRSVIPFTRDDPSTVWLDRGIYFRHLGLYAYRASFLQKWKTLPPHPLEEAEKLEQLRALANGFRIALIETEQLAPGIDTPEDLQQAEAYLAHTPDLK